MAEGIHFLLKVHLKEGRYPTPNEIFVALVLAAWQSTLATVAQSLSLAKGRLHMPCLVWPRMALQELMPVALYQKILRCHGHFVHLLCARVEDLGY